MKSQSRAGYQGGEQIPAVKQDLHCFGSAGSQPRHDSARGGKTGLSLVPHCLPSPHLAVQRGHFFSLGCAVGKTKLSLQYRDGSAGNKIEKDTLR